MLPRTFHPATRTDPRVHARWGDAAVTTNGHEGISDGASGPSDPLTTLREGEMCFG